MDLKCTTSRYADLYAPWLAGADRLLDHVDVRGRRVLDVCGGTGATALAALERGARKVVVVDLAPRVATYHPDLHAVACRAEEMADVLVHRVGMPPALFDVAVCRQALAYLDLGRFVPQLAEVLRPGGVFVFNTFARPRTRVRGYRWGGRRFLEASVAIGRRVVHLQASPGVGADVTAFRWHTAPEISAAFEPSFDLRCVRDDGRSLHFVATRR